MHKRNSKPGKVILAGAGPGDPELLTIKAMRYLQQADVVITDRLVSDTILNDYVSKQAQILNVGKQCSKGESTPQHVINDLLVEYAQQGNLVVRLKGGDVSFFSNILDELHALSSHQIAYEIIPGVTAASGAAAYAGIPLTARGYSTAVRFLTYYKSSTVTQSAWRDLASTEDTLVFYMSSGTLHDLSDQLVQHGASASLQMAIIEQATTPQQKVFVYNVHDYAKTKPAERFLSPSLVIIGKVTELYEAYAWLKESGDRSEYFKPVNQSKIATERA